MFFHSKAKTLISRLADLAMDYQEEECLNVYWKIKNFSYCWENIRSPDFTFSRQLCCLELRPNDIKYEIDCLNSERLSLATKIALLTRDGSEEKSNQNYRIECTESLQVPKDIIFGERRNSFLPKDTLNLRCQIRSKYERGKVSIRSQIGVQRKSFLWALKNLSSENKNETLSVENSDQYGDIQLNLKSVGGINSDQQFYIEISRRGGEKCYCVLKVSVLDNEGKAASHISDEFVFQNWAGEQFWRFPPIIRNSKLLACKNVLLPNDVLSLKCEFAISLGKVSDQTAVYSYNRDIVPLLKDYDDLSKCFTEEDCSTDLKTDLKNILDNGTFCDVSLKVGSDVFPVHKNILSARSPVFEAMFTKDMKETINNTVVIEDIDTETVRRLILYMYTDTISDFQWENVMSLYFAADKYEVLSLKQKCSSFLKANISFSNVCDVLVLADLHQDSELKSVVLDFLSKYDSEIFASEPWRELEKTHSSLAFQTLREICSNKRLD